MVSLVFQIEEASPFEAGHLFRVLVFLYAHVVMAIHRWHAVAFSLGLRDDTGMLMACIFFFPVFLFPIPFLYLAGYVADRHFVFLLHTCMEMESRKMIENPFGEPNLFLPGFCDIKVCQNLLCADGSCNTLCVEG
jgi:hypothetical protein